MFRIVTNFEKDVASRFNKPGAPSLESPAPGGLPRDTPMPPSRGRTGAFAPDAPNKTPGYPALPNDSTK